MGLGVRDRVRVRDAGEVRVRVRVRGEGEVRVRVKHPLDEMQRQPCRGRRLTSGSVQSNRQSRDKRHLFRVPVGSSY